MSGSVQVVGTRIPGIANASILLRELQKSDATSVAIATAYWDGLSLERAGEVADAVGGPVRVLLWTAGGSKAGWKDARIHLANPALNVRFVDPPEGGGIFHAKLGGVERADGSWKAALLGSMNLTDAALRKNVELGVMLSDLPDTLTTLRGWYDDTFAHAIPAEDIDWDRAIKIAPEGSEAASRSAIFREAKLAAPARAGAILPPFG